MNEKPEKTPKAKRSFKAAVEAVCEGHGFVDWAIVVRAVDGNKESFWEAGDGENPIGDRERAGLLLFEMEELKGSILEFSKRKR